MKKQIKKGVSLFLAVLMLLSCWVWVAPEKAAAADTPYRLSITYYVDDPVNAGTAHLIVKHKNKNGTGTETTTTNDVERMRTGSEGATYTDTFSYEGFPTQIQVYIKQGGMRTQDIRVQKITLNDITILEGTFTIDPGWYGSETKTWKVDGSGDFGSDTAHSNWKMPYVVSISADSDIELNAGRLDANPADDAFVSGSTTFSAKDQYGVNYEPSFALTDTRLCTAADGNKTIGSTYATSSVSGKTATVGVKPLIQTLNPTKRNSVYYLYTTCGSAYTTSKVTINFQSYTTTFNANGGKIGYTDGSASNQDNITISEKYYGDVIGMSPDIQTRKGYDFIGFYKTCYVDAFDLATPSYPENEKFVDKSTTVGENGDTTYYAAWIAKGVNVTFKTADGQTIATLPARYDSALTNAKIYKSLDELNKAIEAGSQNAKVSFDASHNPIYSPDGGTYVFKGWKMVEAYDLDGNSVISSMMDPDQDTVLKGNAVFVATYELGDKKQYKVDFYGTDGNILSTKSDYNFNEDVVVPENDPTLDSTAEYNYEFIGWAKRLGSNGAKYYALDSANKTEDGAVISYFSKDIDSWLVKGDAEYVPVFRRNVRKYTVKFVYNTTKTTTATVEKEFSYGDQIVVPSEISDNYTDDGLRYTLTKWTDENGKEPENSTCNGAMTFTANYDEGQGAIYKINFYNRNGEIISAQEVKHGGIVEIPDHSNEKLPQVESDDTYQYTFKGWSEQPSTTALKDVDYYAEYTEKKFANVHFYNDGVEIYSLLGKENNFFVGETIPAYDADQYGVPSRGEDLSGTYVFKGWEADEKIVVPGNDVFETSELYLNAVYETQYKNYTVKFVNDDGTEIETKKYHYGDKIDVPKDPTKDEDNTYTYEFKSWSPDLTNHCYGDVTYEATYRKTYKYYQITWFNEDKKIETSTNYIYNERINAPTSSTPVTTVPSAGKELVIEKWVKCDATGEPLKDKDGNEIIYVRGDRATEAAYYYPVFKEVGIAYTVTFFAENGTTKLGEAKVSYGSSIEDANYPHPTKQATDEKHFVFENWIDKDNGSAVNTITGNTNVKATFKEEAHSYNLTEILTEPTCTSKGLGIYSCSCGKNYEGEIDIILDEAAPDIKTYVGTKTWTLNDYADGIDYSDVIYVGPKSNFIINTTDIGTRYVDNPDALKTRRVGEIAYYISDVVIDDPTTISNWETTYSYDEAYASVLESIIIANGYSMEGFNALAENSKQKKAILAEAAAVMESYEANSSIKLENLGLENDKEYIIYIKASDRVVNGSANTSYMSTGKFHYGTVAPVINVTGKGNSMDFCEDATIEVTDDNEGVVVTLDGKVITLDENGKYAVSENGSHIVTAKDANGNITTVNFAIGTHKTKHVKISASCENAGNEYDICTRCSTVSNRKEIPAIGHKYTDMNSYDRAPSCVEDGYRVYTCANGCGKTLVVKPTDENLDELANTITGFDKAEILALKATGKHTFEKVLDEDDKETSEDKWIIDKEARCNAEGSKHKTCTKCGENVIEAIAADTINGHKYYSAKVVEDSTCTETGYKSRTCRYCGHVDERCEIIPMKSHVEGEYVVTLEPTCTDSGKKIMTCKNCDAHMGEEIKVDALGHRYKLVATVEPTTESKGYYKYECERCHDTYTKDYAGQLKQYTVTFRANADDADAQIVTKTEGETITALDYETPTKEADNTYTYSFSHWVDENGETVKLPIEVSKDMTLTAVYSEKYINYTLTYYYEDGVTQYKKVGYLHYGDTVNLQVGPKKSETNAETFAFDAWEKTDKTLCKDTITIEGNTTLRATYKATTKTYKVIYQADNFDETHYNVLAGSQAPANEIVPKKDYDSKYHYTFKAWDRAAALAAVYSNIYTTPLYTSELHSYTITEKTAATCTESQIVTYTCECGYSFDKEGNAANGHNWGDPVFNAETGKYEKTCSHCDATTDDVAKFSVSFWASEDAEKPEKTINYLVWGTTLDASKVPTGPSKEQTSEFTYSFIGWAVKGDETKTIVDPTAKVIKSDMDYVAVYKAERRLYTVVFAYDAENPIKIVKDVPAGSNVVYDGATPTKAFDATYHYKFSGWSASTNNVQSNITVNAKFESVKHSYSTAITPATCEVGEGTTFTCTCGHSYTKETSKALGHDWKLVDSKLPTNDEDGYNDYACQRCDATKHEIVEKKAWIYITVNVRDEKGNAVDGALVEVYDGKTFITSGKTDANGQVILAVPEAKKYTIIISGGSIDKTVDAEIDVKEDGSYDSSSIPAVSVTKCSCACHRTGLWGRIFRFFHKIIKSLTGEFKCCNNPDPQYYS